VPHPHAPSTELVCPRPGLVRPPAPPPPPATTGAAASPEPPALPPDWALPLPIALPCALATATGARGAARALVGVVRGGVGAKALVRVPTVRDWEPSRVTRHSVAATATLARTESRLVSRSGNMGMGMDMGKWAWEWGMGMGMGMGKRTWGNGHGHGHGHGAWGMGHES
jgi:hypothetical protein